jgi:peptide/nickel transport system permease protein
MVLQTQEFHIARKLMQQELEKSQTAQSMKTIVFNQFLEHKMAVAGLVTILILIMLALCAPLISHLTGLSPSTQNPNARYLKPFDTATLSYLDRQNSLREWLQQNRPDSVDSATTMTLALKEPPEALEQLQSASPDDAELAAVIVSWQRKHIFGTDELGRDVFIRLLYGTRVSLGVGVLVALVSALIGFFIGSIAGFYGGLTDTLLMRVTDALLSLPTIPVLIVLAAIDLQKIPWLAALIGGSSESIFKMVIILCVFSWMPVARLVRGAVLSLRERDFILAARTLGANDITILGRHMLPNVIAPMLVSITLGVGESILAEAALSFLGLGIMPPTASWGNMLNNAQEVIYNNIWLAVLPGLMILITVISFNFLGDGLQDAMDPKSIRR